MKKGLFLLAAAIIGLTSCNKDDEKQSSGESGKQGFYYSINGGSKTKVENAKGEVASSWTRISAMISSNEFFEIMLPSLDAGNYTFSTSSSEEFVYYKAGDGMYKAASGTLKITKNDGSKMSGTFSTSGTGMTGVTEISGEFNDMPVENK